MTFGELINTFRDNGGEIIEIFPYEATYKITVGYNHIDITNETFLQFVEVFKDKPITTWAIDMTEIDDVVHPRIRIHFGQSNT